MCMASHHYKFHSFNLKASFARILVLKIHIFILNDIWPGLLNATRHISERYQTDRIDKISFWTEWSVSQIHNTDLTCDNYLAQKLCFRKGIIFIRVYVSVRVWVCLCVCEPVPKLSQKVLDRFWLNLAGWCIMILSRFLLKMR